MCNKDNKNVYFFREYLLLHGWEMSTFIQLFALARHVAYILLSTLTHLLNIFQKRYTCEILVSRQFYSDLFK